MASQGSSSSSYSFNHHVFFCFSASDTRYGFSGNLLKALHDSGIRAFVDDEEELEVTPSLVKAIQHSRIAIIVFSKNYAASSRCLDVLAYILDYFQGNHRFILPVYYEVDPSDVGPCGEALARHEETFKDDNGEKAQKWRNALCRVANLPSWHFKHGDGYEFEFIGGIVREVSRNLLYAADSRLQEVCLLLELGSDEVLMIGMYGMPGTGKATLAQNVHDIIADQFEGSCFLDVGASLNKRDLAHLQSMLLSEIVGEGYIDLGDADRGISIIKDRLHRKKVLLILAGVQTLEQLEALAGGLDWFGSGSRVIIVTLDRHLLAFHGVERRYEVQALNHKDALELLVDPSNSEFLNKLVTSASRFPSALKETGSNLFGKSVDDRRYALYRSKRSPHNDIQEASTSQSVPAVSQTSQSVPEVSQTSQSVPEVSQTSQSVPEVTQTSQSVPEVTQTSQSVPEVTQTSQSVPEVTQTSQSVPEVSQTSQSVPEVTQTSQSVPEVPQTSQSVPEVSQTSQSVPEVSQTSQSVPEGSQTSQSVPEVSQISQSVPEVSQTSQRVASVVLQILQRVLQAKTTWRLVGLVSSVVGLSCNALSPSFNRLIGGRNSFKLLLYELLSLVICTIILFAKESSFFTQHVQLKTYMNFMILMIISMYSFFYDKAVDGKPEILSLVSNAAFSLMSLSLSKLIRFGFETGMFSYFIGCLAVQLFTINRMLILVAILYGCPLFYIHSSSDSRPEVDYRGQAIDSSLDSEPEVDSAQDIHSSNYAGQAIYSTSINQPDAGNGSQVFHSYSDFQPEVIRGGQVIRSSSDSRPEVGSGVQHVVDIRT